MSGWAPRRFWTEAKVTAAETGFALHLDGRGVKTPAKAALILPSLALAEGLAAEWQAQGDKIDPRTMPLTRAANSAIDTVGPQRATVQGMIAAYGGSDLLCYRAESPAALAQAQAAGWDPLLAWAAAELGAPLRVTAGMMPIDQPAPSLAALNARLDGFSAFELAAVHDLVGLTGSLVLGLAAAEALRDPETIWRLSRIDEDFQAEHWGRDDEAAAVEAFKRDEFDQALRFLALCRG